MFIGNDEEDTHIKYAIKQLQCHVDKVWHKKEKVFFDINGIMSSKSLNLYNLLRLSRKSYYVIVFYYNLYKI